MPTPGFTSPEASSPRQCRPGGAMKLKGQGCLLDITNSPATASTTPLGTKVWGLGSMAPAGPGRAEEPAFITDETFDFDFVLSPTSQERGDEGDVEEEDDDDEEVFFGPMGHREKCIMVGKGLQQQDLGPEPHWSPLTGDKFVQVCKEATLLALHMEKACVAGEAPAAGHVSRSSRSKARARVVERFVEESCSKLKLLEAVRAPAQLRTPGQESSLPRGPTPGTGNCPYSDRRVAGDGDEGEVSGADLELERPQPQPSTNATLVGAQQLPSCTSAVMATQASDDGGEERPLETCPVLEDDTLDAPALSSLLLPSRTKLRRPLGLRPPAPVGGTRPPPGQQKISSSSSSGSCSSLLGLSSSHRASPRGSSTASAATGGRRLQGVLRPSTGHPVQPGGLPRPLSISGQQAPASRSHPARASALPSRRTVSASDGSVIPGGKRVPSTGQLAQCRSDRGGGRAAAGGEGRGTPVPPSGTGDAARAVGMGSARHPATPSKEGRQSAAAFSGDVASGETRGVCRAGKPRGVAAGGKLSEAGTPVKLLRGQRLVALGSTDRPPAVFVTPSKLPPRSTIPTPVVGSRGGAMVPPGSTPASVTRRRSCIPAITPIRTPASLRPRRDPDGMVAAAAIAVRADAEGETVDTQASSQLLFSPPATDSLHATTRGGGRPCSCRRSPRTGASAGAPLIPVEASSSIISVSPDSDVPLQNVVVNLFGSMAALEQLESLLPAETFASQGDASGDLLCGFVAEKSTQAEERPLIDLSDSPEARDGGGGGGSGNSKELIDLSSPLINLGQKSSAECLLINIDSPLLKF